MRFVIGVALGFAVGLAGALLFAPDTRRSAWPEGHPARSLNGDQPAGFRGALRTLQDHVNEAWEEARAAAEQSERDMTARYQEARASAAAESEREMRAIYEEAAASLGTNAKKEAKKAEQAAKKAAAEAKKAESEAKKAEAAAKKELAGKK
jgi:hypothetical protein